MHWDVQEEAGLLLGIWEEWPTSYQIWCYRFTIYRILASIIRGPGSCSLQRTLESCGPNIGSVNIGTGCLDWSWDLQSTPALTSPGLTCRSGRPEDLEALGAGAICFSPTNESFSQRVRALWLKCSPLPEGEAHSWTAAFSERLQKPLSQLERQLPLRHWPAIVNCKESFFGRKQKFTQLSNIWNVKSPGHWGGREKTQTTSEEMQAAQGWRKPWAESSLWAINKALESEE